MDRGKERLGRDVEMEVEIRDGIGKEMWLIQQSR